MAKATPIFIAGQDYPVKYGFAALRAFSDATGTTLGDLGSLGDNMSITQALALVWAGLKDGARVMNQEFVLSIDDVADLMDEDDEAMTKVLKVFQDSLAKPTKSKGKKKGK
tara:strand:+ start:1932 stop:2264 length:333 start_codon:yes stop_codon:yes gene_type:complete